MPDWNAELYLKFEEQRTKPALDLAAKLREYNFKKIADIGCGPGNSTAVLKSVFPHAYILGIDNSESMIQKAKRIHPGIDFRLCSAESLDSGFDLLFSNACLQWVPNHKELIPGLIGKLNGGGVLAVQMPANADEALYKIIQETAANPKWAFSGAPEQQNKILSPAEYYGILSACAGSVEMWETIYYHALPGHGALLDWARSTRLRPYLGELSAAKAAAFEAEIAAKLEKAYPLMKNGDVILRFKRFFFIAHK
ncbi:MAG: methyltransferase domain-containing protein [Clostridiales bacterium]|nr:methyltransferase domain-containing protein [Clostridiales bacterium]